MSGRLIGAKSWDRSVETFGARFGQSMDCLSNLCDNLCIKLCFGVYEAGNGLGFWFHKVEPMLGEWATHGQPTARLVWGGGGGGGGGGGDTGYLVSRHQFDVAT